MPKIYKINLEKEKLKPLQTYEEERCDLSQKLLSCYDLKNGHFDGTKMQRLLFPQSQTSIFLSHSYVDINEAIAVREEIEERSDAKVFVDSLYWESVYDAQDYIKSEFGYKTDSILKHLHIMITTAIAQMIQSSQYFLFLESQNSVSQSNSIDSSSSIYQRFIENHEERSTQSPWIYYELQIAKMLEERGMGVGLENYKIESMQDTMKCFFDINDIIKRMQKIELENFIEQL